MNLYSQYVQILSDYEEITVINIPALKIHIIKDGIVFYD